MTGGQARIANAAELREGLTQTREATVAVLQAFVSALGKECVVPYEPGLNPPLWEAGHIAWFQDYWIHRNPTLHEGCHADPFVARKPDTDNDQLFDSSAVSHESRWSLALPSLPALLEYLQSSLTRTLHALSVIEDTAANTSADADRLLYFFRLAWFHELMHLEAASYMAQGLGISLGQATANIATPISYAGSAGVTQQVHIPAQDWQLGYTGHGFAFDNELQGQAEHLHSYSMDTRPVMLGEYLAFVESTDTPPPLYVEERQGRWHQKVFDLWEPANLHEPVLHVSWFEAQAYCEWVGRSLPSEAQWECAVMSRPEVAWGGVWEWTSSRFLPYDGFVAHPYRDYSAPWFGSRMVLKGAANATTNAMRHPRYRNYFTPQRRDIYAGFRTCAQTTAK